MVLLLGNLLVRLAIMKMIMTIFFVVVVYFAIFANCLNLHRNRRSIDLNIVENAIFENRLPRTCKPIGYNLHLQPDFANATFNVRLELNLTCTNRTSSIALHLNDDVTVQMLEIRRIGSDNATDDRIEKFEVKRKIRKSQIEIVFGETMAAGSSFRLWFVLDGRIEQYENYGFFMNSYEENEGVVVDGSGRGTTEEIRGNQFPTEFRPEIVRMFRRAVFQGSDYAQRSSAAIVYRTLDYAIATVRTIGRTTSPPMSVYTFAIVIAEFSNVAKSSSDLNVISDINRTEKSQIRIFGRKSYHAKLDRVSQKVKLALQILETYFDIDFPLPKLDLVALPKFRNSKQADNWGLILFRETDLNNENSSLWKIFQELIYQWIGSFATPVWWSDNHITKALNSFMAIHLAIQESNRVELRNWPMTSLYSLYYDYGSDNPISRVNGLKPEILSAKTELVFRMINYTLGENFFRNAIRKFLNNKKYDSFDSNEILDYFTNEAHANRLLPNNLSVTAIVNSWILSKEKLPLISVSRNYNNNTALVKQVIDHKILSFIPIMVTNEETLDFRNFETIWMSNTSNEIQISNLPDENSFVIINPEEIGPFQVNYDTRNWNLLLNFLLNETNVGKIPVKTKAKLLHEAWNFAYYGMLEFDTALNLTLFLKYERDPMVWQPIFPMIDTIGKKIAGTHVQTKFQIYARNLLFDLYNDFQNNRKNSESVPEDLDRKYLEETSKQFLCRFGYKSCYDEQKALFDLWTQNNYDFIINYNCLCTVLKWGEESDWEIAFEKIRKFPKNRNRIERSTLLKTLTICPNQKRKIRKLLECVILNEENGGDGDGDFSENDISTVLISVVQTDVGYRALYEFLTSEWPAIRRRFAMRHQLWDRVVYAATASLKTDRELAELEALVDAKRDQLGSAEIDVRKSLKIVRRENRWIHAHLPLIEKWLDFYSTTAIGRKADNAVHNRSSDFFQFSCPDADCN